MFAFRYFIAQFYCQKQVFYCSCKNLITCIFYNFLQLCHFLVLIDSKKVRRINIFYMGKSKVHVHDTYYLEYLLVATNISRDHNFCSLWLEQKSCKNMWVWGVFLLLRMKQGWKSHNSVKFDYSVKMQSELGCYQNLILHLFHFQICHIVLFKFYAYFCTRVRLFLNSKTCDHSLWHIFFHSDDLNFCLFID